MNARVCHFDSGMTPIEKIDAQKVFEFHHALADARSADAERLRGAAETKVLRHRQGLDHRGQFNFRLHENPLKKRLGRAHAPAINRDTLKKIFQNKLRTSLT